MDQPEQPPPADVAAIAERIAELRQRQAAIAAELRESRRLIAELEAERRARIAALLAQGRQSAEERRR